MDGRCSTPTSHTDIYYKNAAAISPVAQASLALSRIVTLINRLEGRLDTVSDKVADIERKYSNLEQRQGYVASVGTGHKDKQSDLYHIIVDDLKEAMYEATIARALAGVARKLVVGVDSADTASCGGYSSTFSRRTVISDTSSSSRYSGDGG